MRTLAILLLLVVVAAATLGLGCLEGEPGSQGLQGDVGPAGEQGPQGEKGDKGDPADPPASPVILKDDYSFRVSNGETKNVALFLEAGDRLVGSFTVDGGTIDFWVRDPSGFKILARDDRSNQPFALIAATDGFYKLYFYNGAWFSDYMVALDATRYPSIQLWAD